MSTIQAFMRANVSLFRGPRDAVSAVRLISAICIIAISRIVAAGAPAIPPAPAPHNDPGQSTTAQSDTIGTTAGNFRVDESGAATYSMPIAAAAGTAGVAPQISLNYSTSGGNGIAGMGWSIGGLSSVSRCRQTFDQDKNVTALTWTGSDRFCLDGQRLLVSSGQTYGAANSTYRTEIDSGVIVTAIGNTNGEPDYFEAKRKDGSTSYYGKSPDSVDTSAKLTNGAGQTLTWSIRHFKDSVGNPIWFEYDTSGGAQRLTQIRYAFGLNAGPWSGDGARIQFNYETRADRTSGYVAGYLFENNQRLAAIKSINNDSVIREYIFRYNEGIVVTSDTVSRLTSIQECVGSSCLPKSTFGWRTPPVSPSLGSNGSASFGSGYAAFTPADINGDGLMDLVWLNGAGSTKSMQYAISTGTSYTNSTFSSGSLGFNLVSSTTSPLIRAIDYNLDGRQDITWYDGTANVWKIVLSEPYGSSAWRLNANVITTPVPSRLVTFADVDSNGTTDAVYPAGGLSTALYLRRLEPDPTQSDSSSRRYTFGPQIPISGSGGTETIGEVTALAGDFNGDGQVDIAMGGSKEYCDEDGRNCVTIRNRRALVFSGFSGGTPTVASWEEFGGAAVTVNGQVQIHFPIMAQFQAVDVNGDGLSDAFYPLSPFFNTVISQYALQINKGNGEFEYYPVIDSSLKNAAARPQFVDWNMDGYADLLWKDIAGSIKVRYWNPDSKLLGPATTVTSNVSTNGSETVSYFDVNGDAVPDIVKINSGGTIGAVSVLTRKVGATVANRAVNRIESFTNGIGAKTQVTFEPLSFSNHYDRLQVSSSAGTQTVCQDLGHPGEEVCWEEPIQVANASAFYSAINGEWELPSGAQTFGKRVPGPSDPPRNVPVIELSGPMYVVTDVVGDAPAAGASPGTVNANATSSISYYYSEAKIQAAGRGLLGFQRLKTVDNQTGVQTITRYRQDWPFTGSPIFTEVLSSAGHTLSKSATEWQIQEWTSAFPANATANGTASLGALHVVQSESSEQGFDLAGNGAAQGTLLSTVTTTNTYDTEANATQIVITTRNGGGSAIKTVSTSNTFLNDGNFTLFEGRLGQTTVATTLNGVPAPSNRVSSFNYHASGTQRGLLWKETIEPSDSLYTHVTTHSYDAFGNRVRSSAVAGGVTRCNVNTVAYDSRGRYADTTFDCLGRKLSQVTSRNAYGSPLTLLTYTDVNGTDNVSTQISYSVLGCEYYRHNATGSSASKYLTLDLSYCPTGTVYKASATDATGSASQECFDKLGRSVRSMSKGFDGLWDAQDTEYDQFGRAKRKSEPFDLSTGSQVAPYWTTMSYDLLGRVTLAVLPDGSPGSTTYIGLSTTTTNAAGQTRTEVRNVQGEITDVYDNLAGHTQFTYDHQGNMTSMLDTAGNSTIVTYDKLGRKTQTNDPDKGIWSYSYNKFGELTLQTDAKAQTQTITYDGLGRMLTRVDKKSNGTTEASSVWTYDTAAYGLGQLASVQDTMSGYMRAAVYDNLGRPSEVVTNLDGGSYYEMTTYDQFGRVFQVFDAAGDGNYTDLGIVSSYNIHGYLDRVSDAVLVSGVSRTTYRSIIAMNARGQVTIEHRGIDNQAANPQASVLATFAYNNATGRLEDIDSVNGQGLDIQDLEYDWDNLGNLTARREFSGTKNLVETFGYDGLNRLTSQTVSGQSPISVTYDAIGNIKSKTGVGTYTYGVGTAGPHAVTKAGSPTYAYDLNGNNTSGDGRTIAYTSYDLPSSIVKGSHTTTFAYGPDRARFRRIDVGTAGTTTTRYVGNVEIIFKPNGDQDRKRYIAGVAVETVHFGNNSIEDSREIQYLHKDHLGSLDVITNSSGAIVQEQSFDAWGQRRNAINWTALTNSQLINFDHSRTTRGFTGHEMLDEVGIVHMNGRIYDPKLGRFLQADPFVQDPTNTQGLNRYSYVFNNPLAYTDPSGFSAWTDFRDKILKPIAAIVISVYLPGAGFWGSAASGFGATVASGFVAGAVASGNLKGATLGAFGAGLFFGVGNHFSSAIDKNLAAVSDGVLEATQLLDSGLTLGQTVAKIAAHATAGGVMGVLQGGKFGHGFVSAGLVQSLGGPIGTIQGGRALSPARVLAAAIVGGTSSALTGGKFANGAVTGAFSRAFNDELNHAQEVFFRAKIDKILSIGYSTSEGFRAEFEPREGFRVNVVDGTATVTQGTAVFTFDVNGITGGGIRFFGKQLISLSVRANVQDNGDVAITGSATYNRFFTFGGTVTVNPVDFVVGNSGYLGQAARDLNPERRRQSLDCSIEGDC